MFNHSSVGRLGLFLSPVLLLNACAVGEIGGSAGEPRFDVGFSDAALTCPGVSADVRASDSWESKEASQPAPDALYFEVMARPTEANLDALVAVGAQDIHDFSDAAITVRFSETGLVDVMDETEYSSDGSFEYDPGVWYNIAISANVTARTYDVEVGRCGERRRSVVRGARFRTEANVYDRLSNWGVWSSQRAALELSTPTWMTSGTCAPSTCQALGAECGRPSDGCNGSLNCGVCGGGQSCSSGACVEEPVSVPPPPSCTPASCQSLGAECGGPSDGCGGILNCGGCGAGQLCSNNVCVDQPVTPPLPPPACIPTSCQALGADCGVRSNGCGGILNCGGCNVGQLCSSSLCIDQPVTPPPPPACTPDTCQSLGTECGQWGDGCGGILSCGSCSGGETCSIGVCVPPPPPACTPASCQSLGAECGTQSDGCGGTVNCDTGGETCEERTPGESCNGSGQCVVAGSNWWEVVDEPNAATTGPNCSAPSCPFGTLSGANAPPGRITTNGATYENFTMSVDERLYIDADNVTLRNFYLTTAVGGAPNGGAYTGIVIEAGASGFVMEYGEIEGHAGCGTGLVGEGFTARYMNIHSCDDSLKVGQNGDGPTVIQNSYLWDNKGGHGDAIQFYPDPIDSPTILIEHNAMVGGGTGIISGLHHTQPTTINENWLYAGVSSFGIYCEPVFTVTGNLWERNGWIYGYADDAGGIWGSDNLWMDDFSPVPDPAR